MMYNLINTIANLPTLVGCKDFPNDQQGMQLMKLIQDFINEEYKYDSKHVNQAFMLAAKQELYLDNKRIDPSTFGQFLSVNVVGKILTAYKEKNRAERAAPNTDFLLNAPSDKATPKDIYDLCVEKMQDEDPCLYYLPLNIAYKHMISEGLLQPVKDKKCFISVKWLNQHKKIEITAQANAVIEYFEHKTK